MTRRITGYRSTRIATSYGERALPCIVHEGNGTNIWDCQCQEYDVGSIIARSLPSICLDVLSHVTCERPALNTKRRLRHSEESHKIQRREAQGHCTNRHVLL